MARVRVKICGLTRPEDAALAVSLGAWALGVIFAPESPRRVGRKQAAAVLEPAAAGVERVGVFVNAGLDEIVETARACGLTVLQLHGDESPDECLDVGRLTGCLVIKALRVAGPESLAGVVTFDTDFILLDTYQSERHGGTGRVFDWSLAAALPAGLRSERLILSGGLNPDNIAEAVRVVAPLAVDVASGVESAPGMKDAEKMKLLFDKLNEMNR
ncbi:MAG: phosphoribosylanthranilate isomerase [Thermoleophilia bacterium]|jgi:phosphoribosylanthranilate isomerase